MLEFKRFENESDEELIYRVCSSKDVIGSWQDVANILNELLNTEYTESKFRKQFQSFQKMLSANQHKFADAEAQLETIKLERQALEKEKVKFRDERNSHIVPVIFFCNFSYMYLSSSICPTYLSTRF